MARTTIVSTEVKNRLHAEKEENEARVKRFLRLKKIYRGQLIFSLMLGTIITFFIVLEISSSTDAAAFHFPFTDIPVPRTVFFTVMMFFDILFAYLLLRTTFSIAKERYLKPLCLFASVSAAESLEKGDFIDARFFTSILFSTIKSFTNSVRISVKPWSCTLKEVIKEEVDIFSENHKEISRAVMNERELSKQFSSHMYLLADELFSKKEVSDFNKTIPSLHFFIENTKKYRTSIGFLAKHRKIKSAVGILTEFLKLTIATLIGFVFWLLFGYTV